MKLNHADYPTPEFGEPSTSRFDEEVISRHHKVVDIIRRHLKDMESRAPIRLVGSRLMGSAVFAVHHDFR